MGPGTVEREGDLGAGDAAGSVDPAVAAVEAPGDAETQQHHRRRGSP
jgi:hypothetical protein